MTRHEEYTEINGERNINAIYYKSSSQPVEIDIGRHIPFTESLSMLIDRPALDPLPLNTDGFSQAAEIRALQAAREQLQNDILNTAALLAEIDAFTRSLLEGDRKP